MTTSNVASGRVGGQTEYAAPPIVEALCQFNFSRALDWSPVLPGLVYEKIRASYPQTPEVQQELQANVMVPADGLGEAQFNMGQGEQRLIFANDQRNRLVLLAPSMLSVNSLPPYEGWPSLHRRTADVIRKTKSELRDLAVTTVSVRYINRVSLPWVAGTKLQDYFDVPYRVVGPEGSTLDQILLRQESSLGDGSVKGIRTFTRVDSDDSQGPEKRDFVLDLEFVKIFDTPVSFEDALESAGELKILENQEFEGCITDKTRELFG